MPRGVDPTCNMRDVSPIPLGVSRDQRRAELSPRRARLTNRGLFRSVTRMPWIAPGRARRHVGELLGIHVDDVAQLDRRLLRHARMGRRGTPARILRQHYGTAGELHKIRRATDFIADESSSTQSPYSRIRRTEMARGGGIGHPQLCRGRRALRHQHSPRCSIWHDGQMATGRFERALREGPDPRVPLTPNSSLLCLTPRR